ncbi:methyltransferase domain-containing protein [Nocardiopsis alborubida]|uniref:Protein-L-isoaspartate O-methyltransferase n=1 Tax=Nocardiopsis alborubida TaxID=146802 RepID=A0A7X6RND8_9ACTN|nr:methyltransferase domain-containing protein [Nocardiopsis alborubida]NKY96700.1 methyltransferase domain-containing protein [Nocardiopsis alborubida]
MSPGAALARVLSAKGALTDPAWQRAVLAVDRTAFVPDTVWAADGDGWFTPLPRAHATVQRWMGEDVSLITQIDDGHPTGADGRGRTPSSSLSQPSLVVAMLQALNARDGMRILEIGTGTGYNTSLLCERFGADAVTSIEIDPSVAEQARDVLDRLGYKPTLLIGDGAAPTPGEYDLLLSTVAVRHLPAAWSAALRPGGVIVTPWSPGAGFASACLLRLETCTDGGARGRPLADAAFMLMRSPAHRPEPLGRDAFVDEDAPGVRQGLIQVNPRVVTDRHPGWTLALGHLVPGLGYAVYEADIDANPAAAGEATIYVFDRDGASWSLAEYTPAGSPFEAKRYGPRDLWAEIAAARAAWQATGSPGRDRLGVDVDPTGHAHLWVDERDRPLAV